MDIHRVLAEKFSSRVYTLKGDFPNHELKFEDGLAAPSNEELQAEWNKLLKEDEASIYINKRSEEYPAISEMVVALWESLIEGRPEAAQALQAKRSEIKSKYPKPEVE